MTITTEAKVEQGEAVCALSGVEKRFGGVVALAGVDLEVHPGLVHAIVGENGAGKSTLMKIIAGAETPDSGTVSMGGRDVHFSSVKEANDHGVAIVFQELSLYPELDVLANLFMQREVTRMGLVQRSEMRAQAQPVLAELGLDVDLDEPAGQLALSEQQLVEIAKALLADASVLILDEPNSALNAAETERLFEIVRGLRARGVAVLFISHRLEEVFEIADLVTVMRNGQVVTTMPLADATIPQVISLMIGRQYAEVEASRSYADHDAPALRLQGVSVPGQVEDVSLQVAPGEVVGLAGLEGSGVSAVLEAIFGMQRPRAGTITLPDGHPAPHTHPRKRPRRHRHGAGRPPQRRTHAQRGHPHQRGAGHRRSARSVRLLLAPETDRGPRQCPRGRPQHRHRVRALTGQRALRRQPAEGRHRQVARS